MSASNFQLERDLENGQINQRPEIVMKYFQHTWFSLHRSFPDRCIFTTPVFTQGLPGFRKHPGKRSQSQQFRLRQA
jgi:hypothetical protein